MPKKKTSRTAKSTSTIKSMKPGANKSSAPSTLPDKGTAMRLTPSDIEIYDKLSALTGITRRSEIMRLAIKRLFDSYENPSKPY